MTTRSSFALLCALTLPLGLGSDAAAQEPPSSADIFVDQVEVQLVEVEVVVTDRQGRRVRGLPREDFTLTVEGRTVPIQLFEEIYLPPRGESSDSGSPGAADEAPTGSVPGRSILVFVDDTWTDRRGRSRALKNLRQELGALGPKDEAAVVRYQSGLLDVITPWTADPATLDDAFERVLETTPGDLARRTIEQGHPDPRVRDRVIRGQIRRVANAAAVTMAGLAGAKGRKLFVPVSSGWPYDRFSVLDAAPAPLSTGPTFATASDADNPDAVLDGAVADQSFVTQLADRGDSHLDRDIHPVFAAANRLGYTIYPIHVGIPCQAGAVACTESYEASRGALRIVALETGGGILAEEASNSNPLTTALEDTRAYYVLAFDGSDLPAGASREIAVSVRGDRLRARHRRSILALTTKERADLVADRALLLGEGNGDLDFAIGDEQRKRRVVRLPVTLTIPMDWATTLPAAGGGVAADLELRVASLDERGDRSETVVIPLDVAGPQPPPPGSHATYELTVEIRPNTRRVVLVLHDKITGESLSSSYERDL